MKPVSDELIAKVQASGLFDDVPREFIVCHVSHQRLSCGEALCRKGDAADCLWVILQGSVEVREGDTVVVVRKEGEVIGEQAMLDPNGIRTTDLVARGDARGVELACFPRQAVTEQQQFAFNMARVLSTKLSESVAMRRSLGETIEEQEKWLRRMVGNHVLGEIRLAPNEFFEKRHHDRFVIWFSDIVGFSSAIQGMAPNRAAAVVESLLNPHVTEIQNSRGFIDKFMGDGVMAYWPVHSADGAEECSRAVETAFAVRAAVREVAYGDQHFDIRIGLHMGEVVAGNFGSSTRSQYTLIGREVNLAARLEQARCDVQNAPIEGAIRLSREVYEVIEQGLISRFNSSPVQIPIKQNPSQPVPIYVSAD